MAPKNTPPAKKKKQINRTAIDAELANTNKAISRADPNTPRHDKLSGVAMALEWVLQQGDGTPPTMTVLMD